MSERDVEQEPGVCSENTDRFSAWVRWHGPYRTRSAWKKAAEDLRLNDRVRLYFAIGRWKMFSISFSRPLYLGLNSKDSKISIGDRLDKHIDPESAGEERHLKITGLLNEYWLGEIMTRWHCGDTSHVGITKDVEASLIYCIAPIMNSQNVKNPREYGFQVINEIARKPWWRLLIKTRFEQLVYGLYRYDPEECVLIYGDFVSNKRKARRIVAIRATRAKRRSPRDVFNDPFAYRIFGSKKIERRDQVEGAD